VGYRVTTFATYEVHVDWLGGTAFTGAYDDVTGKVRHFEYKRGRQFAHQLAGKALAGQAFIYLDNRGGTYSAGDTGFPIIEPGTVIPGRVVRIRTTAPSTTVLWRGVIESIENRVDINGVHVAVLKCIGPLGFINQRQARIPMGIDILTGAAIGSILDDTGWPAGDRSIDAGQTTMTRFWVENKPALDAMRDVEATESGYIGESKDAKIVFEDRDHRLAGTHITSQATYTDDPAGVLFFANIEGQDPIKAIFNDVEATVHRYSTLATTTLWKLIDTGANAVVRSGGGTFAVEASYPIGNPTATLGAVAVASWTTPTATVDFNVTDDAAGVGANINASLSTAFTTYAQSAKVVLTNTGAVDGYVQLLQVRGVPLIEDNKTKVRTEDADSQTDHGRRSFTSPGNWLPNVGEARDWGAFNISIYKTPFQIFSVTLSANYSSAHMTEVLARDVSDLVTIDATGRSDLRMTNKFFIEQEHHRVSEDRVHWVTYDVSAAAGYGASWVLDTGELGTRTKPGY
jgi:hypothetical protein